MKLETFEDALKDAIKKCNNYKMAYNEYSKVADEDIYDYDGQVIQYKYNKMQTLRYKLTNLEFSCNKFFETRLPNFIKKNKIKGEELTKLAMVVLKYAQICYHNTIFNESLIHYFDKSNMHNEMLLKELIKTRKCGLLFRADIDEIFVKYNLKYLEDYIISKNDMKEITRFVIDQKNIKELNLSKFEKKILENGSFDNLYDYLYEVERCNQKKVLTRILEIATPKQLKQFSRADADRKAREKATSEAYSSGYSSGSYYSGDFDLC